MKIDDEDRELREAFSTLRREEQAQATPLSTLLRAGSRQRSAYSRVALAPVLAGVAILVALGLVVRHELRYSTPSPLVEVALATWVEPTAFLLKTPGQELLHTMPAFGRDRAPIDLDGPASPTKLPTHVN